MSKSPTDEEIDDLKNNEITFEEFAAGYKDMRLGVIKTTKNVTLSSERNVYEADESSYIQGDSITINAMGDAGTINEKIELIPSREVAVYTRAGNSVYLENKNDLKVNKIDVTGGETESAYAQDQPTSIDKVIIISEGNITNAAKEKNIETAQVYFDKDGNRVDKSVVGGLTVNVNQLEDEDQTIPNIRAEYISLDSGKSIGEYDIELKTKSAKTDIKGKVRKKGNIRTKDKRIAIDNINLAPDYSATVQLYTRSETFHLITDSSNNVRIDPRFVVRHDPDIVINGTDFNSSMESEAIKAGETNRKNSDRKKNKLDDADDSVYGTYNLSDDAVLIRTIHGEVITPENVYNIINPGNNLSENHKKTKKKAKASIYDRISYFK